MQKPHVNWDRETCSNTVTPTKIETKLLSLHDARTENVIKHGNLIQKRKVFTLTCAEQSTLKMCSAKLILAMKSPIVFKNTNFHTYRRSHTHTHAHTIGCGEEQTQPLPSAPFSCRLHRLVLSKSLHTSVPFNKQCHYPKLHTHKADVHTNTHALLKWTHTKIYPYGSMSSYKHMRALGITHTPNWTYYNNVQLNKPILCWPKQTTQ